MIITVILYISETSSTETRLQYCHPPVLQQQSRVTDVRLGEIHRMSVARPNPCHEPYSLLPSSYIPKGTSCGSPKRCHPGSVFPALLSSSSALRQGQALVSESPSSSMSTRSGPPTTACRRIPPPVSGRRATATSGLPRRRGSPASTGWNSLSSTGRTRRNYRPPGSPG